MTKCHHHGEACSVLGSKSGAFQVIESFRHDDLSEHQIAHDLNRRGITRELGQAWTRGTVHQVLINEKYIGNNVWNRVSFKLKTRRVRNQPSMWIRSDGAFPALINQPLFEAAQAIIKARSFRLSDAEMLEVLRDLRETTGLLSAIIIDEADGMPSSSAYRSRFGSLLRAYQLVGYVPRRDYRYIEINRALRALYPKVVSNVIEGLRSVGCALVQDPSTDLITINEEMNLSIVIVRCRQTPAGSYRWRLRFDVGFQPDITVAVRMDAQNAAPLDYYLLPAIDIASTKLKLTENNGLAVDGYRFDSLDILYDFVRPIPIQEAA